MIETMHPWRALLFGVALLLTGCGDGAPPQSASRSTTDLPANDADAAVPAGLELRIVNARIIDGTGAPARDGEVHVRNGRIVHVGAPDAAAAEPAATRTIDAAGRVVAPGFIDPHSHGNPLETPEFENFLAMGVTTVTLGQDGSSPDVDDLRDWLAQVRDLGPNLAMFVGHGTLRSRSGIGLDPDPDETAMARMLMLLDANLEHAYGLSTGLEYNPGLNAGDAEMMALAEVVGARDRVIMSHMRNEDDPVLEDSLAELIRQGSAARVHVAHIKSVYGRGAARGRDILGVLAAARAAGVEISADVYPYTASHTGIALLFPVWAKTVEQFDVVKETRRDELADYLRRRVNGRNGPEATLLGMAPYAGMTLAELATQLEKPFEDVLIDDLGPAGGYAAYFIMDEALQSEFIRDPHVSICSDGSPTGFHPRGHGTHARIIETYVQERGLLSLEGAVRKMSSLPAAHIGIRDRGVLAAGMAADLIIFDPAAVRATASYDAPISLAEGFDIVIVAGQVVRENGALTAVRPGRVLRPD